MSHANPDERRLRFESTALPFMQRLYNTALHLTGDADDAADVLQDTYFRAYRTFDNFRPGTNAKAWLFTILYSVFFNRRRKRRREVGPLPPDVLEQRFQLYLEQPSHDEQPVDLPGRGRPGHLSIDKTSGPTAGAETLDALEFLARVVSHIPNKGQVLQRSYGWYANRTRGIRRQAGGNAPPAVLIADVVPPALGAVRRRWAELLRRIFEVDPLRCPQCGTAMRVVAFLTAPAAIDRILTHLQRPEPRARRPRAPPRRRAPARPVPSV